MSKYNILPHECEKNKILPNYDIIKITENELKQGDTVKAKPN